MLDKFLLVHIASFKQMSHVCVRNFIKLSVIQNILAMFFLKIFYPTDIGIGIKGRSVCTITRPKEDPQEAGSGDTVRRYDARCDNVCAYFSQ